MEILVVISILALLFGIAFRGGSSVMTSGKIKDTEALLATLDQAIVAYQEDVSYARVQNAGKVFGTFPPDNLYVFDNSTEPGGATICGLQVVMARKGATIPEDLTDERGPDGHLSGAGPDDLRHGDMRALVLAMRLRSPKASAILDRIDSRFLVSGRDETDLVPGTGCIFNPTGDPKETDTISLDYYVDSWGVPIEYYATRVFTACKTRDKASAAFVAANNGQYLLVSYGPDGEEQLSRESLASGDSTLVGDYFDTIGEAGPDGYDELINNVLNQDNIYSSDTFKKRMMSRDE